MRLKQLISAASAALQPCQESSDDSAGGGGRRRGNQKIKEEKEDEGLGLQSFNYLPALFLVAGPIFFLCLLYFSQSELCGGMPERGHNELVDL
eukprot:1161321-Pelagomonas_calceolata.AAC.7